MKTDGLTFTEAVQALEDGRCEKIGSPLGARYWINSVGVIAHEGRVGQGIISSPESFLGKWRLIGVKQKVVYNDVVWMRYGATGHIYPVSVTSFPDWSKFIGKPGMKVTLEWPE